MDMLNLLKEILLKINSNKTTTISLEFYPYKGIIEYNILVEGEVLETFDTLEDAIAELNTYNVV